MQKFIEKSSNNISIKLCRKCSILIMACLSWIPRLAHSGSTPPVLKLQLSLLWLELSLVLLFITMSSWISIYPVLFTGRDFTMLSFNNTFSTEKLAPEVMLHVGISSNTLNIKIELWKYFDLSFQVIYIIYIKFIFGSIMIDKYW